MDKPGLTTLLCLRTPPDDPIEKNVLSYSDSMGEKDRDYLEATRRPRGCGILIRNGRQ